MSQVSLGRPEFVSGTPPGHPTAKFLYVIFLYRFFLWEVLNGFGVDGVGGIFPFFRFFFCFSSLFRFFFLRFSSLFFVFLRSSLVLSEDKGKRLQFTAKMGNFTPTPSAPTPCKTSRFLSIKQKKCGHENTEKIQASQAPTLGCPGTRD